jgi:hypothetical protein
MAALSNGFGAVNADAATFSMTLATVVDAAGGGLAVTGPADSGLLAGAGTYVPFRLPPRV